MLNTPIRTFLTLLLSLCGPVVARADQAATQDETVVRTTYAKLGYAVKVSAIHDLLMENHQPAMSDLENRLAAKEIKFELSDFFGGSVKEIARRPFSELVTRPDGRDVIDVVTVTYNMTEDLKETLEIREKTETGARPKWAAGQNLTGENWNLPFSQALAAIIEPQNKSRYARFVSYRVTVALEGKSRSYKAMFLFGDGEFPVLVLDNVTNNSALGFLVNRSLYPAVLLESNLAQKPAITNWLKIHQMPDSACPSGQKQVCCDLRTLVCGVKESDVNSALRKGWLDGRQ